MSKYGNSEQTGGPHVTREQIELRAYEIYQQRGGTNGSDVEDWLIAERELLGQPEMPALESMQADESRTRRAMLAMTGDSTN